jgi:ApbE superfamily uncharacterized protein (UPF0280 family)
MSDAAATMIANLKDKTGKTLEEWLAVIGPAGDRKHGEIMKFLKGEHGVSNGFANLITLHARDAMPVAGGEDDLVAAQYAGPKADLKPIYDKLAALVEGLGGDVELAPKKAYVSLRRAKQFGLIQPSTKTRVDVGINLKGREPEGRLEASGSFNAMVSHRVRLGAADEVDAELEAWLKAAYEAAG